MTRSLIYTALATECTEIAIFLSLSYAPARLTPLVCVHFHPSVLGKGGGKPPKQCEVATSSL